MKKHRWQVVDEHGEVVLSAKAIDITARMTKRSARKVAEWEAKHLVDVDAGDRPVYAVRTD